MRTHEAVAPVASSHAGHVLTALGFMVAALVGVALAEQLQRHRAAGSSQLPGALLALAAAGAVSGGIHLAVLPAHWREAHLYGAFFLLVGAVQLSCSALLLLVRRTRELLLVNGMTTLGLLLVWLQTRSLGVPFGPDSGHREPVGLLDTTSVLLELLVLGSTAHLLRRPQQKAVMA